MAASVLAYEDWRGRRLGQIIAKSSALKTVLEQVERVAPTDSTVLIQGETGTGKELIAHAVHNVSPRSRRPFIKLNCAAIPFDLLENELFGHERGAFTGAIAQKIGRFEMADKGTLFLDEVGDIPPALQPKLLRVLQEQEFERLGSGQTHHVDVRLVAATHRDLAKMVGRDEFRSDLYYRLNVFPISVPPLRARSEDIPALVEYFVEMFSHRVGKQIDSIPVETMDAFRAYSWPGNVRELQNLVERAVILANEGVLANPLAASAPQAVGSGAGLSKLRDLERALIVQTLEEAGWVIAGPKGAAVKLGLKRTTLAYKMKMFQIERPTRSDVRGKLPATDPSHRQDSPRMHRSKESLRGKNGFFRRRLPPVQHDNDGKKRDSVEKESCPCARLCDERPPSAGPTARARLKEAAFKETAAVRSGFETMSVTTACQDGPFIAEPIPNANVKAKSPTGEMS